MGSGGTEAHADGLTTRRVDPDMEQILASIRKIISDDQKALGLSVDDAPLRAPPRRVRPGPSAQGHPAEEPATSLPPAQTAPRPVPRPAPHATAPESGDGPDDDMDLSLHRMSARARALDVDTGLPPRPRPPVRLSAAPPVDYRPPEARAEPAPAAGPSPLVDQRLASIIRHAVAGQVAEAIGAHTGGQWGGAPAASTEASWDGPDARSAPPGLAEPEPLPSWPVPRSEARASGARLAPALADSPAMQHGREAIGVLVTPATAARISGAFDALTQRVAAERARTMEETVTDMLRPMLANWLETHLPEIVERLVAEQVARLSRGETG